MCRRNSGNCSPLRTQSPSSLYSLLAVVVCARLSDWRLLIFTLDTQSVGKRWPQAEGEENGEWSQREELLSLLLVVIVATAAS